MIVYVEPETTEERGYVEFSELCAWLGYELGGKERCDWYITHRHPTWVGWRDVSAKLVEMNHYYLRDSGYYKMKDGGSVCSINETEEDAECYT